MKTNYEKLAACINSSKEIKEAIKTIMGVFAVDESAARGLFIAYSAKNEICALHTAINI
jgi:copper chaperone CopZ